MVSGPDQSRVGATSTWRITPGWLLSWPTLGRQLCLFQALSEFLRERCRESADVFFMSVLHEALPDRVRILEDLLPVLVRQPVVNLRIFPSSHRTHGNEHPFCRVALMPLQDFAVKDIDADLDGRSGGKCVE